MIARLAAALLRIVDAFFPPTVCAWCKGPTQRIPCGDERYAALFCTARCQRSWEEA